jgi:hypothetical protein
MCWLICSNAAACSPPSLCAPSQSLVLYEFCLHRVHSGWFGGPQALQEKSPHARSSARNHIKQEQLRCLVIPRERQRPRNLSRPPRDSGCARNDGHSSPCNSVQGRLLRDSRSVSYGKRGRGYAVWFRSSSAADAQGLRNTLSRIARVSGLIRVVSATTPAT